MPWRKGQSGNPHGRPRAGFSLAELVNTRKNRPRATAMLEQLWLLANEKHDNPLVRLKAIELLAKLGWTHELTRGLKVTSDDGGANGSRRVIFELIDGPTPVTE